MSDELFENVSAIVGEMQGLAKLAHAQYAAEVDAVIAERRRDTQRIERLLDRILDFGFDDAMVQLFKRLCRYYYTIDPAATVDYVHAYRDMWDSEEDEVAAGNGQSGSCRGNASADNTERPTTTICPIPP